MLISTLSDDTVARATGIHWHRNLNPTAGSFRGTFKFKLKLSLVSESFKLPNAFDVASHGVVNTVLRLAVAKSESISQNRLCMSESESES